MLDQQEAILKLLADDDPETVALVRNQLVSRGDTVVRDLEHLLKHNDDARVSHQVKAILGEIDARNADADFEQRAPRVTSYEDLEQACWLLSRALLPGIDIGPRLALLNQWGDQAKTLLADRSTPRDRIATLARFLCEDLAFTGNTEDYYNPRNSILPCLIDSRLGIPISLSLIFILVGNRAGTAIDGVNLPGHFIARHEDLLFDPFHGGKPLSTADCAEIMARQNLRLEPAHLLATPPRMILLRMLANLLYSYEQEQDEPAKSRLARWLNAAGHQSN